MNPTKDDYTKVSALVLRAGDLRAQARAAGRSLSVSDAVTLAHNEARRAAAAPAKPAPVKAAAPSPSATTGSPPPGFIRGREGRLVSFAAALQPVTIMGGIARIGPA